MTKNDGPQQRWIDLDNSLAQLVPEVMAVLNEEDEFDRLLIKNRADGTYLAVLKCLGPDGGELVCFGSGYGYSACLLALNQSVRGNNFRPDKPWQAPG